MQENDTVRKIQAGETGLLKVLVEAYQERVYNTCFGFFHNSRDAEDTAQEVFVQIYHSLHQYRHEAKLSTWIYRITVRKCYDLIRKRKRKKRFGILVRLFDDERPLDIEDGTDPSADIEQQERYDILYRAIDGLAEKQRIALTLHKFEGLKYQEVARVMDTTVSAVESLIHRAVTNLRQRLTNYYSDLI